jgi:hypothetical protein
MSMIGILAISLAANSHAIPAARLPVPPLEERWQTDPDGAALDRQTIRVELPPRALRLAILPDRTTGRDWGLPYLRAAVEDLRRLDPDAVFTIGDMVQGYTRSTDQWDAEAATWREIVSPLEAPLLPVAGNHDVVSGTRDPTDRRFDERYRRTFGPLRYVAELPGATVIVAFSDGRRDQEGVAFSPEDLAWLADALDRASERDQPIVLLTHRPMWRYRSARWDELVHPLLAKHGVDAVIAGHFHALQRDPDLDGVQYHILGACGGMIDQHPLTGQLQHLTFVTIPPAGEIAVHHQLVGATFGPDHVSAEDQERAWKLKQTSEAAAIVGAIEEPIAGPTQGSLSLELFNPLDVPVRFSWAALQAPPMEERVPPASAGGLAWNSRTAIDTFNPFTMRTDSPLAIAPGGEVELGPLERRRVELPWEIETAPEAPLPPTEIRIAARYLDSKQREVPITLIRRVPVARTVALSSRPDAAGWRWSPVRYPISAWEFSPYDTLEPDADARLAIDERGDLRVMLEVPDRLVASAIDDSRLDRSRLDDPMVDAIRLELGEGPGRRRWLVEFDRTSTPRILEDTGEGLEAVATEDLDRPFIDWQTAPNGWRAQVRIPRNAWPTPSAEGVPLQIGIADNDDTYHTQWRWLAPPDHPVRVVLPGENAPDSR